MRSFPAATVITGPGHDRVCVTVDGLDPRTPPLAADIPLPYRRSLAFFAVLRSQAEHREILIH
ncbi:hypothetical protein GCM10023334_114490 [Nonomuraea thailandensis]